MNKNLKRGLSFAAVAATAAMLLTACAPATFKAEDCKDAKLSLGSLLPTTGNLAFLGAPEIAGVDLAVKEINENGGVAGGGKYRIVLVREFEQDSHFEAVAKQAVNGGKKAKKAA